MSLIAICMLLIAFLLLQIHKMKRMNNFSKEIILAGLFIMLLATILLALVFSL